MTHNEAIIYGKYLVGKTAQSTLLKELTANGRSIHQSSQRITDYEVVEMFGEYDLMLSVGGETVLEQTLFNIR